MKSPCEPAHLHKSAAEWLENRLVTYALAAGATVIAASRPAEASVIYWSNPNSGNPAANSITNNSGTILLDFLNNSGISANSQFEITANKSTLGNFASLWLAPLGTGYRGVASSHMFAEALPGGVAVNSAPFTSIRARGKEFMAGVGTNSVSGPWTDTTGFLALKFVIGPNTYFGWAQLTSLANSRPDGASSFDVTLTSAGL